MRIIAFIITGALFFSSCKTKEQSATADVKGPGKVSYPDTKTIDQKDVYFGDTINDMYRWLENEGDTAVRNWIAAENNVTFGYLEQIPYRNQLKQRLTELANYPKMTTPYRAGEYYFYSKNDGLQNQYVTYYKKGLDGEEKVFFDPNTLSADGTVTLNIAGFSNDRKYVAVSQAKAGSDWNEMYVREVAGNTQLADKIEWTKFSGAAWQGDGFYYAAFDAPKDNKTYTAASEHQKVYFHKLGTAQSEDKLIYKDKDPNIYVGAQTTEDEKFLLIYLSAGTSGTGILWKEANDPGNFKTLFAGYDWEYTVLDNEGNNLIVQTNYEAPNYKVVLVDPKNPAPENWKNIIPEQKEILQSVSLAGGKLFASYLKDVSSRIIQYDRKGTLEKEAQLPGLGTVGGFTGEKDDQEIFYSFVSFTTPADIYKYTIASGKSEIYKKSEVQFDASAYETKQMFYTSKDGTKVPMFIVHKKGLKMDGSNPCLLYGYGGFNIPITPSFSTGRMALLEQGYIYAVANLRGGSEYGEEWHKAGMLEKKQTVFDDFIAAAEYLIAEKYTSADKLAIQGRSNGGLLVGAAMTQRPDLFAVALPGVGVLDMMRYHKFTVGWGWAVEYGSSDHADQYAYLKKYSPLHNLKPGTEYPATFITTADHDDRVVPAHSFKFAAALQEAHAGDNPVLIRIDVQAGHGAGKPLAKIIDEDADWMSFMMWNSGIKFLSTETRQ
ncbi:MAG: S9 family peptidase [Chitinophagales bacterium]|nr:S9 family peptidase [Chitinophagales bacterium]